VGFLVSSLTYFLILLVVSAPALFMARRRNRPVLIKRFMTAAAVGGTFCGIVAAGSQRLVNQCEAEGNPSCFDAGADGMIILLIVGFLGASLLWTYLLFND
jgi:hypothetical protein